MCVDGLLPMLIANADGTWPLDKAHSTHTSEDEKLQSMRIPKIRFGAPVRGVANVV